MKVVRGLRKLLHPPELMVWIHCGLDSCGLDQGINVVKGLRKLLHPSELMAWIHCGLDSCGLAKGVLFNCSNNYVQIYLLKRVLFGSSFGQ